LHLMMVVDLQLFVQGSGPVTQAQLAPSGLLAQLSTLEGDSDKPCRRRLLGHLAGAIRDLQCSSQVPQAAMLHSSVGRTASY
jgi:hypothetical protein